MLAWLRASWRSAAMTLLAVVATAYGTHQYVSTFQPRASSFPGPASNLADESAFTAGTSLQQPSGGVFNDSMASLTSGQSGVARSTPNRAPHVNIRSQNGTELATASNPLQVALATGLSQANDTVGAVSIAGTTGGATLSRTLSAASTNSTTVKNGAGTLYGFEITNTNAAQAFFKLYNKASPVVGTDTPVYTLAIPQGSSATQNTVIMKTFAGPGVNFSTGIGFGVTGGQADNDTTAVLANQLVINILYQ